MRSSFRAVIADGTGAAAFQAKPRENSGALSSATRAFRFELVFGTDFSLIAKIGNSPGDRTSILSRSAKPDRVFDDVLELADVAGQR
jgi:hypothetical protein